MSKQNSIPALERPNQPVSMGSRIMAAVRDAAASTPAKNWRGPATPVSVTPALSDAVADAIAIAAPIVSPLASNAGPMLTRIDLPDPPVLKNEYALLFQILRYCRGHTSEGERVFIEDVLIPTLEDTKHDFYVAGPNGKPDLANYVVTVPLPSPSGTTDTPDQIRARPLPTTLFSCHIDTVHGSKLKQTTQRLAVDAGMDHVFLAKDENRANCLGADNGAGVWLLLRMIQLGVPGVYVFHRGEESGCIGSKWMADNEAAFLQQFKRAIAFDRKDDWEVITHQRSQRTCSDAFATALSAALKHCGNKLDYRPSANGAYTDTASYVKLIPECTNVGVSYHEAHGNSEYLDYDHVGRLLHACTQINWEHLPTVRDVNESSYKPYNSGFPTPPYNSRSAYPSSLADGHDDMYSWKDDLARFQGDRSRDTSPGKSKSSKHVNGHASDLVATSATQKATVTPATQSAKSPAAVAPPERTEFQDYIPWTSADFEDYSATHLMDDLADMEPQDTVNIILDLLEEAVALKAALKFRRAAEANHRQY